MENVGKDSESQEDVVIYKPLYPREDNFYIWVRPLKMFLEEIPERPDNITGQKHRFELVENLNKNYLV